MYEMENGSDEYTQSGLLETGGELWIDWRNRRCTLSGGS